MSVYVVHTDMNQYARQLVGPFILVGRHWYRLPEQQRHAVLCHEMGHVEYKHQRKRVWCVLTRGWRVAEPLCRQQELEADSYAVRNGHSVGLLAFLNGVKIHKSPLHPTHEERIANIKLEMKRNGQ